MKFITTIDKSELTICAGGRYDSLVEYFGGPETAGFGFGLGLERLLLVLDKQGIELPVEEVWMFTLQYLVQVPMAKLLS